MFAKASTRIPKFLIAGALASAANLAALYIATEWFGLWYLLSSFFAYVISFFTNFTLQSQWVFGGYDSSQTTRKFTSFFFNAIFDVVANLALLHLFVEVLLVHYMLSQTLIIGMLSIKNFLLYQKVIFKGAIG